MFTKLSKVDVLDLVKWVKDNNWNVVIWFKSVEVRQIAQSSLNPSLVMLYILSSRTPKTTITSSISPTF